MTTESQSTSQVVASSAIQAGFARRDLAAAKVMVKYLVAKGLRKGPTELLILPDSALEKWFDEDAASYLLEQKRRHHQTYEVR